MQAIRLQKKYPEVTQDEMFDLINRFKSVVLFGCHFENTL
jgi:plastin-1